MPIWLLPVSPMPISLLPLLPKPMLLLPMFAEAEVGCRVAAAHVVAVSRCRCRCFRCRSPCCGCRRCRSRGWSCRCCQCPGWRRLPKSSYAVSVAGAEVVAAVVAEAQVEIAAEAVPGWCCRVAAAQVMSPMLPLPRLKLPLLPLPRLALPMLPMPRLALPVFRQPHSPGQARQALQRLLPRRQLRERRRGPGVIARHRGHILGPHLLVCSLSSRDRRGVEAQQVGVHQRHQQSPIRRHRRRGHRGRPRRLKHRGRRFGLPGRPHGSGRRRAQPPHIGCGRARHRRRRLALPGLARQARGHRGKRGRRRTQLAGQPLPGRRRRQQRPRPRTGKHPRRIDLRRQHQKTHRARPLRSWPFSARSFAGRPCDKTVRGVSGGSWPLYARLSRDWSTLAVAPRAPASRRVV